MAEVIFEAHAQYDDVKGAVAVDGHTGSPLHDIFETAGLDADNYFPVAFKLYREGDHTFMTLFSIPDVSTYNEVENKYRYNNDTIPVVSTELALTLEDLFSVIKRLDVVIVKPSWLYDRTFDDGE